MSMDEQDALDAAWAHHEEVNRQFEEWTREQYPQWFIHRSEKMKTSQMVQSKFLKKDDFPEPQVLTIRDCVLEEVGRGDERWVLYFKEKTKGVVLNVTKIRQLESGFGDDTDLWVGKKVKLSHDPTVMMGQQVVGGIKFILPPAGKPAPKPEPKVEEGFDDDIPF